MSADHIGFIPPVYKQIQLAIDSWAYPLRGAFSAAEILSDLTFNCQPSELCDRCLNISLWTTLSSLHHPQKGCILCQILKDVKNKAKQTESLLKARRYIRICAVPADTLEGTQDDSRRSKIQPGLPVFLQSGSPSHFKLINGWLRLCDQGECGHDGGRCPKPNDALMPTRVIDVGEDKIDPDKVYLISTNKISTDKGGQGAHYVALSHCWGESAKGQIPSWCTTRSNEEDRTQGFLVKNLPATFKDAIRVTRELGKRYLWIDSLCIIQGDDGDWGTEAMKMETVFKNAYCTIAATSAEDSTKGFLNRPVEESNLQYVTVPNSSHGKVYVCTSIDDFPGDVEEGVLNKRAWVLQERALSRRTIHFTKRQTYWECGGGTDRPVAIDSLARELAKAFRTNVRYGIFERYLHRSLLWRLSQNIPKGRIYDPAGQALPSWSWMAYSGQIEYLDFRVNDWSDKSVEWDKSVQFVEDQASNAANNPGNDGYALEARVLRIKPGGLEQVRRDEKGDEGVHLWFDQERNALIEIRCAIMGRETRRKRKDGKQKYYVLVVTEDPEGGSWVRVGMGSIEQRFILFDGQDVAARIK
ncbi:hypothetical protein FANTH_11135 [Fusarium anthophilum]|uniref:Heterokaryon incompatibility domain-containing protein n=1 Tax=Fusarium anthophilum TaxID=48485 RepID=A0A8H4YY57_9HYPO|nr:hypothetical protein FANTH_11135 [Fusarium anthophilum]